MLGDLPLGAEPLGGIPVVIEIPDGGAAPWPVSPILHQVRDFHMHKYHRRWWERWIEDFSKVGLPPEEEPEKPTISQLLGWDKLRD